MTNRPPVCFDRPVRDKFTNAGQRFGGALVSEPGVPRINNAKQFHYPQRCRAADQARHANRPIHRVPDKPAREDQALCLKVRLRAGRFSHVGPAPAGGGEPNFGHAAAVLLPGGDGFTGNLVSGNDRPGRLRTERFGQQPTALDFIRQQRFLDRSGVIVQGPGHRARVSELNKPDTTRDRRAKTAHQRPIAVHAGQINQRRQQRVAVDADLEFVSHLRPFACCAFKTISSRLQARFMLRAFRLWLHRA